MDHNCRMSIQESFTYLEELPVPFPAPRFSFRCSFSVFSFPFFLFSSTTSFADMLGWNFVSHFVTFHHSELCFLSFLCWWSGIRFIAWINNTVGYRNHKAFFLFLFWTTIHAGHAAWIVLHDFLLFLFPHDLQSTTSSLPPHTFSVSSPIWIQVNLIIAFFLAFFFCLALLIFGGYHFYLIARNTTTIESMEREFEKSFRRACDVVCNFSPIGWISLPSDFFASGWNISFSLYRLCFLAFPFLPTSSFLSPCYITSFFFSFSDDWLAWEYIRHWDVQQHMPNTRFKFSDMVSSLEGRSPRRRDALSVSNMRSNSGKFKDSSERSWDLHSLSTRIQSIKIRIDSIVVWSFVYNNKN